jgi:type IV pilus assembly protein PilA
MQRRARRYQAGYTLAETMAVVAIIGILASLAVYGVRQYIFSARTAEARQMILAIKAAEETYRQETYVYLNASAGGVTTPTALYPQICVDGSAPGPRKYAWAQSSGCADAVQWQQLGVASSNPVMYGYGVKQVAAGEAMPSVGKFDWLSKTGPGFAVVARGDLDGDGKLSLYLGSNFTDEIYREDEDE